MKVLDRRPAPPARSSRAVAAATVMDVGLLITRVVRAEVRKHRPQDLSLPQIRALAFVSANPDASASQLADYLGLTRPTTSKLLEQLVRRGLVARTSAPGDRRRAM